MIFKKLQKFLVAGAITANPKKLKTVLVAVALLSTHSSLFAQESGLAAITQVSSDIAKYIPVVQKLIFAIAGVVALGGAISVFIKMNNEENDVKKSIMMVIGACLFLVAAATALPAFFGL